MQSQYFSTELTSIGTLLALACRMISPSIRLEFGSGLPPCLTAIMIFFPKTALVFAFLASVLLFVAARTAAARPMNRGDSRAGSTTLLSVVEVTTTGAKALALPAAKRKRLIYFISCILIVCSTSKMVESKLINSAPIAFSILLKYCRLFCEKQLIHEEAEARCERVECSRPIFVIVSSSTATTKKVQLVKYKKVRQLFCCYHTDGGRTAVCASNPCSAHH